MAFSMVGIIGTAAVIIIIIVVIAAAVRNKGE
jgi:hypothetical protein